MTEVAGEVADGFIAHPFTTRKSLLEHTLPALERGLTRAGRTRDSIEIVCATMIVTADREEELERIKGVARKHLAFYGSTPAYRPTLACHGWEALHEELNQLSKRGRWDEMAGLVDDEMLETIAVVGPRHEIAATLELRLAGIADAVSLTNNRAPDPGLWADVVRGLRGSPPA
jgi:probable F420-dependent oxidoreductase